MEEKAWVISINMGYGHQRTAYALADLAIGKKIINANNYEGIPEKDRVIWEGSRSFYEFVSRSKRIPFIGNFLFSLYDKTQKIFEFYPKRDLSRANFVEKNTYNLFINGWGRHLIKKLWPKAGEKAKPIISTFFTPAFMAEYFRYPGEIYCVVCDADISRSWAPLIPGKSRIKYFAPNERVVERLRLYGVRKENIFLTGYPLPVKCIGSDDMKLLKYDVANRLANLDPKRVYRKQYVSLVKNKLGETPNNGDHVLTLMFAVGGAGAQKEIGVKLLQQFKEKIGAREMKIILVAGTNRKIKEYFEQEIRALKMEKFRNLEIIFADNFSDYFDSFNEAISKADVLWTKPSELSFYSALGLPIIIAPTIGSQEDFNKEWLLMHGFGAEQRDTTCIEEWIFDWLKAGHLAEMAMEGFVEGRQLGVFNIDKIISQ
ncbi:MAG: hypothetical protein PHG23_00245 [Candidatus Pacebacteria bacterium]|nr:hypothetical protein [Candidatus Paceibacterota bacterium]